MNNVPEWVWMSALGVVAGLLVFVVVMAVLMFRRLGMLYGDLLSVVLGMEARMDELEKLLKPMPHPLFGIFPPRKTQAEVEQDLERAMRGVVGVNGHALHDGEDPLEELAQLIGQTDPAALERQGLARAAEARYEGKGGG